MEVVDILTPGLGEDQDVVVVHKDEAVDYVSDYIIDKGLKEGRGVGQAEGHNKVLVVPGWSVERCLPFVPLSDVDQMVSVAEA